MRTGEECHTEPFARQYKPIEPLPKRLHSLIYSTWLCLFQPLCIAFSRKPARRQCRGLARRATGADMGLFEKAHLPDKSS